MAGREIPRSRQGEKYPDFVRWRGCALQTAILKVQHETGTVTRQKKTKHIVVNVNRLNGGPATCERNRSWMPRKIRGKTQGANNYGCQEQWREKGSTVTEDLLGKYSP